MTAPTPGNAGSARRGGAEPEGPAPLDARAQLP
jgi:hypothetical protein